jgi:MFS family permease
VHVSKVWGIPQFWLIWAVLCLNVTAGIGVIGMASPLLQEVFAGKLIGVAATFNELTGEQKLQIAAIAAGFTGLLSLFNIAGRFIWASFSDHIGRKATYFVFFIFGFILYVSVPALGHSGSVALFVVAFSIILSMYGGGFATVPAYLADIFGTQMVGAIHGRLLTAWATAGVLGPVLVNYIREYQLAHGVPRAQAYDVTMYIMSGLLLLGLLCNAMVRPIADKHFMTDEELAAERKLAHERDAIKAPGNKVVEAGVGTASHPVLIFLAWSAVGIPLAWGIWITLQKTLILF